MTLIIFNTTAGTLSYLGGAATVAPSGNLNVPITQIFPISRDSQLVADSISGAAYLTDGVNSYYGTDALDYLNMIALSLGGQVVGYIGASVPAFAILVGSKDSNGNIAAANIDSNGGIRISPNNLALTPSSPTAATVGVSSAQALASNANRKGLILVNTSINRISLGLGATAVLNSGITLFPGGTWTMDALNFTTAAINAIAGAASSNLSIQEFTT